jgi:hypothetical protein
LANRIPARASPAVGEATPIRCRQLLASRHRDNQPVSTSHDTVDSTPTFTMRSLATIASLLLAYCTAVYATALTYRLDAHEKACFFANVDHKGTKVAFYFAVQSGGSFDIDYSVVGPGSNGGNEKVILDGTKERQGDFVFTANEVGEYRFCFNNEMSTFAEKLVDFEIAVSTFPTPASQRWTLSY